MGLSSLGFLISECFLNIRRHALMSISALGTIAVALTILGGSLWTVLRINEFAADQPRKFNEIDVFLKVDLPREQAQAVGERLKQEPGIGRVVFIPRERAWAQFQAASPKTGEALDNNNPLSDAYQVSASGPEQVGALGAALQNRARYPEIDKVNDEAKGIGMMLSISHAVQLIGGVGAIGLFIATFFIVHNTIRLTVFSRRREIHIMQLVGATSGFIRFPLLLEGAFHGLMGAVVASGLVLLCVDQISRLVANIHSPLLGDVPSQLGPLQMTGSLVIIGVTVGLMGSWFSVRKFLKQA